jgi:tetratricopeptide (TPR) repeat protein
MVTLIDTVTKHRNGDFSGAADDYQKLLSTNPDNTDILNLYGLCLNNLNQFDCAIPLFTKAISLDPGQNEYLQNRGAAYVGMGRFDVALSDFQNAISLAPQNIFLLVKAGELSLMLDMHDGAVAYFQKALTIDPDDSDAKNGLAFALNKLGISNLNSGSIKDAILTLSEAVELAPDNWELHYNLGNVFLKSDQFQEAKTAFEHSIKLNQSSVEAYSNYGISCERLGLYNKALNAYRRALDICPTHSDTLFNKSLLLLKQGNYKDGFRLYEERWNTKAFEKHKRKFTAPLWLGEQNLDNKTILLHAEQGLGDTIQFVRFCQWLNRYKVKIFLQCPAPLIELVKTLHISADYYSMDETIPPYDFHCPLMSLPFAFGVQSASDVSMPPYFKVPEKSKNKWQRRFDEFRSTRIGLVFEGKKSHQHNHLRSIDAMEIMDSLPCGPNYFLLQKDLSASTTALIEKRCDIHDLSPYLDDFVDTAEACNHMDLIITVDTSVAHLAGALGKKTLLMLHYQSDWRWQTEESSTPWYQNMEIIRLQRDTLWGSIFPRIQSKIFAVHTR